LFAIPTQMYLHLIKYIVPIQVFNRSRWTMILNEYSDVKFKNFLEENMSKISYFNNNIKKVILKGVGAGAFFGTKTCLTGKNLTPCRTVRFR